MRFPICITVDNKYIVALIAGDIKSYLMSADILRYQSCEKAFISDNRPLKKVQIVGDKDNNMYFGISMLDTYGNITREYMEDGVIFLDIPEQEIELSDKHSFSEKLLKSNPEIMDLEDLVQTIGYISAEMFEESSYIRENGQIKKPFVAMEGKNIVYSGIEGSSNPFAVDLRASFTRTPESRVFLPVPETSELVRVNKVKFTKDDFLVNLSFTSEFISEAQWENVIDEEIRLNVEDIVINDISSYINPWYSIEKIFDGMGLPDKERQTRIEIAKQSSDSIYIQSNMRALGVQMEPSSENYKLLFGKGDYDSKTYDNEVEFREILVNLLESTLLYEYEYYSLSQLYRAKGVVKSKWFDQYMMAQIRYILQELYAYTGKVAPRIDLTGDDDDNGDDSEGSMLVSSGYQLIKVARTETGGFRLVLPEELEYIQKVRDHELEVQEGYDNCRWYVDSINNPEGAIDAMLQLLRIGERKCQYVKVEAIDFSPNNPYFDTKTLNQVKTIVLERAYETVKTQNGKVYEIAGGLYLDVAINEVEVKLPVAVVLKKIETNGIKTRARLVIMDSNKFVQDVTKVRNNGEALLSVEGFELSEDSVKYDKEELDKKLKENFSAFDLESTKEAKSEDLVIDLRITKLQFERVSMFCKEAGVAAPTVVNSQYNLLRSLAKIEEGTLDVETPANVTKDGSDNFILKKIIKMYTDNLVRNQKSMESSSKEVSLSTLIDYIVGKSKTTQLDEEAGNIFDSILRDTINYSIACHVYLIDDETKEVRGYAYQVSSKSGEQLLLVTAKDEIGLRMPINKSNTVKNLNLSKVLERKMIKNFYTSTDLEKQIRVVKTAHKIVLDSVNTIKMLRGEDSGD